MSEIVFTTGRGPVAVAVAELGPEATVLDAVRRAGLPLGQSCRGEGVCRACVVLVLAGGAELSAPSPLERRFGFGDLRRLACQAALPDAGAGARVVVTHPGWGRAPAGDPGADPGQDS